MIEDVELRELFKAESDEHLERLEAGLLHLEQNPSDGAVLEDAFREAHSLKGSSRMLGVSSVEKIAHRFEDILGDAKRGDLTLNAHVIDMLYSQLDAIKKLVTEAVTGQEAGVDVEAVLATLTNSDPLGQTPPIDEVPEPSAPLEDLAKTEASVAVPPQDTPPQEAPTAPVAPQNASPNASFDEGYQIETIRVPPQKLDVLIRESGELSVTQLRIDRRLEDMDDLLNIMAQWKRDNQLPLGKERESVHVEDLLAEMETRFGTLRGRLYEDATRLGLIAQQLSEEIRAIRLLPFATIFNLFSRMVRDLGRTLGKEVTLVIKGADTVADKRILEEMKDPLMHMIRNAVDHGIELPSDRKTQGKKPEGTVRLEARQRSGHIEIILQDDGQGIDPQKIKQIALQRNLHTAETLASMSDAQLQMLIFAPGFSTNTMITDVSGRGVGMDVVRANVERLKGDIQLDSTPGAGSCLTILLPVSLATSRVILVTVNAQIFGFPVEYIVATKMVAQADLFSLEGRTAVMFENQPLTLVSLQSILNLPIEADDRQDVFPCVILNVGTERVGILVSALLDEQEVVVKPLGTFLKRVPNVSGATILETGAVCMILNAGDLIISARQEHTALVPKATVQSVVEKRLLVVEDSITTRTQIRRILERAGYHVDIAVDGQNAIEKLNQQPFDAVVSDVEMPNLDGFGLTTHIRENKKLKELPVILLTSLARDEDRQRGLDVGANAYITKGTFDQHTLIEALERLI